MAWNPLSVISNIGSKAADIIDKRVADKDLAEKLKAELNQSLLSNAGKELEAQRDIIVAEAKAGGPSASWRPHLMYLFMFLIVFNGVIVPLMHGLFGVELPVLDAWQALPEQMWTLLQISLGGYIGGRSIEKVSTSVVNALKKSEK